MSYEIEEKHAKTLIETMDQSAHWKLHPEKKPPFKSVEEAFKYVNTHNEPLCVRVPVADSDDYLTVKATSSGEDIVFSTISFDDPEETRVHHSHLKLIGSSITEMLNSKLPEGKKVVAM